MNKIGIISMYHKNKNYGGLLQAYALPKAISKLNYDCEQIRWPHMHKVLPDAKRKLTVKILLSKIVKFPQRQIKRKIQKNIRNNVSLRNKKFEEFENSIPHSEKCYLRNNIRECNSLYKGFITGSDQVWNMSWYNQEYFLDFAEDSKCKCSYAASMPDVNLTDAEKDVVYNHLKSFNAISTREKETAVMLSELLDREVQTVLDPTLLLTTDTWDEICAERMIKDKYIFCYFLGNAKEDKKIAKRFSKKTGLKLVTLPHLNQVNMSDLNFADINLYNIGPREFISLIKHAEYVITDSFHAAVFSNLYKVKYFVFPRIDACKMDSRIVDLLSLFDETERFCDCAEKRNVQYLLMLKDNKLKENTSDFNVMRDYSLSYLQTCLEKIDVGEDCK